VVAGTGFAARSFSARLGASVVVGNSVGIGIKDAVGPDGAMPASFDGDTAQETAWRSRVRVRARRFVRWATLLSSGEQMVVFLREALVQIKMRQPQEQALDQTVKICAEQSSNNRCE
jgi:hypothetical protein